MHLTLWFQVIKFEQKKAMIKDMLTYWSVLLWQSTNLLLFSSIMPRVMSLAVLAFILQMPLAFPQSFQSRSLLSASSWLAWCPVVPNRHDRMNLNSRCKTVDCLCSLRQIIWKKYTSLEGNKTVNLAILRWLLKAFPEAVTHLRSKKSRQQGCDWSNICRLTRLGMQSSLVRIVATAAFSHCFFAHSFFLADYAFYATEFCLRAQIINGDSHALAHELWKGSAIGALVNLPYREVRTL